MNEQVDQRCTCEICGTEGMGGIGKFKYGLQRIHQSHGVYQTITTTTKVLGGASFFICDQCAKKDLISGAQDGLAIAISIIIFGPLAALLFKNESWGNILFVLVVIGIIGALISLPINLSTIISKKDPPSGALQGRRDKMAVHFHRKLSPAFRKYTYWKMEDSPKLTLIEGNITTPDEKDFFVSGL